MSLISDTINCLNKVRQESDSIIISFSGGKESLTCLHLCDKIFNNIYLLHFYFVKDLDCIKSKVNYAYEISDKIKGFYEYPDPSVLKCQRDGYCCLPNPNIKRNYSLKDGYNYIREKVGNEYIAIGFKQADGLHRRLMLRTYTDESICESTKKVFPLSKWKQDDVFSYLNLNKIHITQMISKKRKSSGIGLTPYSLKFLKEKYPSDFQKVLKVFPFCESVIIRENLIIQNDGNE